MRRVYRIQLSATYT